MQGSALRRLCNRDLSNLGSVREPIALSGMTVQEYITNGVQIVGGVPYPSGGSNGWVPASNPGPTLTNAGGQFQDTPFGGCSSLASTDTQDQEYRVSYDGIWYNLQPVLDVTIYPGFGWE